MPLIHFSNHVLIAAITLYEPFCFPVLFLKLTVLPLLSDLSDKFDLFAVLHILAAVCNSQKVLQYTQLLSSYFPVYNESRLHLF